MDHSRTSNGDWKHSAQEIRALGDGNHGLDRDTAEYHATQHDLRDMDALGLAPTFRRRFKFVAMVGFASTVVVAWQATLAVFGFALYNGGTGGFFWTFVFSIFGMGFVYLTISELSSCFPTAGGQYQWVAECAPELIRHPLSYCTGWNLTLSWCTYIASCAVIIGNLTKYTILVYHPGNAAINSTWLPTVIAILALFGAALINIYMARKFPIFEGVMLFIHLASWAAITVTLWVTSPHGKASEVLFTFTNGGGWSSTGVSSLIGVIVPWGAVMGYDCSVHMTENAQDASKTIPQSLMMSYVFNVALAFISGVTLIFCIGDVDNVLANTDQLAFIQIFLNSTGSRAAAVVMTTAMIVCFVSAQISGVAAASRQLWSFARDGGFPGGRFLLPVPDAEVPRRAVWATTFFCSCLALVNLGPVVGWNAIISLVVVSLNFSYFICIATLLWRRAYGRPLPRERFSLGDWGLYVNAAALACVIPTTVFAAFPPDAHTTAAYMNYAVVMFGGVYCLAAVYYVAGGRKTFNPPIRKVVD